MNPRAYALEDIAPPEDDLVVDDRVGIDPPEGESYAPLDLRSLEAHFEGYEIVDPVTVALQPVTLTTPRETGGAA